MPRKRFTIGVDPIDSQELDLLECLVRVDSGTPLDLRAGDLLDRLIDGGLVDRSDEGTLSLTTAGIDRCRSLHLHVLSDTEAAKVLEERGIPLPSLRAAARERH